MNDCSHNSSLHCAVCRASNAHLLEGQLDNIVAESNLRKRCLDFKKGEPVFLEGDSCEGVYCLKKGVIAIRKYGSDGTSAVMKLIFPGQNFGYRSVLFDKPHKTSAEALTPVSLCMLSKYDVKMAIDKNPKVRQDLINLIEQDLGAMEEKLLLTVTKTIRSRFAFLLFTMSKHIDPTANTVTFHLPVSKKDLSNITGITVESLSRLLKKFKSLNLIDEKKGLITILDRQALHEMIQED
ncbi:Crp/Fnr family transcriptional regulator [Terasakiella sp.]|uniref:Crp/Fnr family transcriptional regulator n=1 Tax=Terasakiella sp. TaxID=2034861 RepID=UPI003AA9C06E